MKKILTILLVWFICISTSKAQNIGINETGATPDPSALLDLTSATKGFLITRSNTASIASPAFGLMTLNPVDSCVYMYSGTQWKVLYGVGCCCVETCPPLIEQLVTNASIGNSNLFPHDFAQTFTATCDGNLTYTEFYAATNSQTLQAGTLKIYSGATTATLIYSQAYAAIGPTTIGGAIRVTLSGVVPITSGSQYTFEYSIVNANIQYNSTNPYSGGTLFQDGVSFPALDAKFAVSVN